MIVEVAKTVAKRIPTLGVCLGHQAICAAYGAIVTYAPRLMHGKQSEVTLRNDTPLFTGLPERVKVARYHSLIAAPETMPDELAVTAITDENENNGGTASRNTRYTAFSSIPSR